MRCTPRVKEMHPLLSSAPTCAPLARRPAPGPRPPRPGLDSAPARPDTALSRDQRAGSSAFLREMALPLPCICAASSRSDPRKTTEFLAPCISMSPRPSPPSLPPPALTFSLARSLCALSALSLRRLPPRRPPPVLRSPAIRRYLNPHPPALPRFMSQPPHRSTPHLLCLPSSQLAPLTHKHSHPSFGSHPTLQQYHEACRRHR